MRANEPYVDAPLASAGDEIVTELIVHGVGGAPPTDLLDDFHPVRVSGDRHAGFYRPKETPKRAVAAGAEPLDPIRFPREAFAWGGLTSGNWSRALWFLLLPFALMNAAGWMHPPGKDPERAKAPVARGALRLVAALGTVMAVVMLAHLAMDIIGYQCGWRDTACRDTHWWLSWARGEWFTASPARILAVMALVPLAGLTLFWAAGRLSVARFEEYVVKGREPDRSDDPYLALEHPSFWQGALPVRRLRRLHFQLGVATTALVLATTSGLLHRGDWSPLMHLAVWGPTAAIVLILALIAHSGSTVSAESKWHDGRAGRAGWIVVWIFMYLAVLVALWVVAEPSSPPARLDGLIPIETILTSSQALLGLVLAVWFGFHRRRNAGSFFGAGAVMANLLAWFMLISLWAGLGVRLADWFGTGSADTSRFWHLQNGACSGDVFCYPLWFDDAAVAFAGVLILAPVLAAFALFRRATNSDLANVGADFSLPSSDLESKRAKRLAKKHRHSRVVERADEVLTVVLVISVAAFVLVSALQARADDPWRFWPGLVTASGWLVTMVPIVIVLIVRLALKNPSARRAVGGVFDVLTFFPRRFHPFAPPCYGERAVPQLAWRLGWLAGEAPTEEGNKQGVLIRAHSQGTAVTAASLLTGAGTRRQVSLMTYGSPLVMLYQRHFPAYFGGIVERVNGRFNGQWVHLYARSDVLGNPLEPVTGTAVTIQHRVCDPWSWNAEHDGDPPPEPLAHSTYHRHPDADGWAANLMGQLGGLDPLPPAPVESDSCAEAAPPDD